MSDEREQRIHELKVKMGEVRQELERSEGEIFNTLRVHQPIVDRLKPEVLAMEKELESLRGGNDQAEPEPPPDA